jgi:hypothetical protein
MEGYCSTSQSPQRAVVAVEEEEEEDEEEEEEEEEEVHLVGFITRKFISMHGHMNVKLVNTSFQRSP